MAEKTDHDDNLDSMFSLCDAYSFFSDNNDKHRANESMQPSGGNNMGDSSCANAAAGIISPVDKISIGTLFRDCSFAAADEECKGTMFLLQDTSCCFYYFYTALLSFMIGTRNLSQMMHL